MKCKALWLIGLFTIVMTLFQTLGLYLNTTPSLPLGLYRTLHKNTLEHGDLVLFCLPDSVAQLAHTRGYLSHNWWQGCTYQLQPLLKPIAGIAGDHIYQTKSGLFINGKLLANSEALMQDAQQRPMPIPILPTVIPAKALLLVSEHHPNSFDSRYFGLIAEDEIRSVLIPIFIVGDTP